jgi:hypothetical protein
MSLPDDGASISPAVVETRPNLARRLLWKRFTKTAYTTTFLTYAMVLGRGQSRRAV